MLHETTNGLITLLRHVLLKINHPHWCYQNYKETRQSKQPWLVINHRSCSNPEWAPAYFSCTPPASATGVHLCSREVATHCTQVKPLKCVWCCPHAPWRGYNWRHCESVLTAHSGSNWHFSKWFLTFTTCFFSFSDLIRHYLPSCSNMWGWPASIPLM